MTQQLNIVKLQQLMQTETSRTFARSFAQRERVRGPTNLYKHRRGLEATLGRKLSDDEYLAQVRILEDAGAGKLVYGRRGKPTYFVWSHDLRKVGRSALNERTAAVKPKATPVPTAPVKAVMPKTNTLDVVINYPDGRSVTVMLVDMKALADIFNKLASAAPGSYMPAS
jgi:hypothetical protein